MSSEEHQDTTTTPTTPPSSAVAEKKRPLGDTTTTMSSEEQQDTTTPTAATTPSSSSSVAEKKRPLGEYDKDPILQGGGKRVRKSAESFKPEAYDKAPVELVYQGQGTRLGDIESTAHHVDSVLKPHELLTVHRFLYGRRAKVSNKEMKSDILNFSGYLKPTSEEDAERFNHDVEAKMTARANKHKLAEIKALCDALQVDRRSSNNDKSLKTKEDFCDCLLEFLAEPKEELTKGNTKKKTKNKKTSANKNNDDDNDDDIVLEYGKMPNDKALRKWVKAYVTCWNLDKATTKHAMEVASDKFGVDLSEKKSVIKEMLKEEM